MPVVENTCPYDVTNGTMNRFDIMDGNCRVYASFNLDGFESKEITIAPGGTIKQFFPQIPELYQGQNTIRILDENNLPVSNASVLIDSQYYETNQKGEIKFGVNFGSADYNH